MTPIIGIWVLFIAAVLNLLWVYHSYSKHIKNQNRNMTKAKEELERLGNRWLK